MQVFFFDQDRTDSSVRANQRTLVTLDTVIHLPFRYLDGYAAFFKLGGAGGHNAVGGQRWKPEARRHAGKRSDTKLHRKYLSPDLATIGAPSVVVFQASGISTFTTAFAASIDGRVVHVYDLFALLAVGFHRPLASCIRLASAYGITFAILKNADCMTVLIRPPMPTSAAIFDTRR